MISSGKFMVVKKSILMGVIHIEVSILLYFEEYLKLILGHSIPKDRMFSFNRDNSDDNYPPRKPLELKGEDDDYSKEEINKEEEKEEVKETWKEDEDKNEGSKEVEIQNISDDHEDEEEEDKDEETGSKIIRASSLVKTTKINN